MRDDHRLALERDNRATCDRAILDVFQPTVREHVVTRLVEAFGTDARAKLLEVCGKQLDDRASRESERIARGHVSSGSLDPLDNIEVADFHNIFEKYSNLLLDPEHGIEPRRRKDVRSFLSKLAAIKAIRDPSAHGHPFDHLDAVSALKDVRWVLLRLGHDAEARRIEKMAHELEPPPNSTRVASAMGSSELEPDLTASRGPAGRKASTLSRTARLAAAAGAVLALGAGGLVFALNQIRTPSQPIRTSGLPTASNVPLAVPSAPAPAESAEEPPALVRPPPAAGSCNAPCCGGVSCTADGDASRLLPQVCRRPGGPCGRCTSGRTCVPEHCAAPLRDNQRWLVRVANVVDARTGEDLFSTLPGAVVCLRVFGDNPDPRLTCSSLADARTPSRSRRCRLAVTTKQLRRSGLEVVVLHPNVREMNFLAWMHPVYALEAPAGRDLCEGYILPAMQPTGRYLGSRYLNVRIHLDDATKLHEWSDACAPPAHPALEARRRRIR